MVDWTIDLMKSVKPTTWSLENVSHPALYLFEGAHKFKMEEYGVPQSRRRIVICNNFSPLDIEKTPAISTYQTLTVHNNREINWMEYEVICSGSYNRLFRSILKPCYTILFHKQASGTYMTRKI